MGGSLHVYLGPRGEIGPPCGRRKTSDDRLDQVMCQSGAIDISFRLNFSQVAPQEAPRKLSSAQGGSSPTIWKRAPDTIQDQTMGPA
jgi:hypothetical protein